jgi:hypothetical protein
MRIEQLGSFWRLCAGRFRGVPSEEIEQAIERILAEMREEDRRKRTSRSTNQ